MGATQASGALEVHVGLKVVPGRSRPRVGLVLGAGGVLGAAWMTGALPSLQERLPRPLGDLDLIVGTSAGSVLAAALRCGIGIDEMVAHQQGEAVGPLEASAVDNLTGGPWPPAPQLRLGSARLMLALLLSPHRVHPGVLASAWLPVGRANHGPLRDMVHALHCHAHGVPVSAEPRRNCGAGGQGPPVRRSTAEASSGPTASPRWCATISSMLIPQRSAAAMTLPALVPTIRSTSPSGHGSRRCRAGSAPVIQAAPRTPPAPSTSPTRGRDRPRTGLRPTSTSRATTPTPQSSPAAPCGACDPI